MQMAEVMNMLMEAGGEAIDMRYYPDPTIKDVLTEIDNLQKQLEDLKPRIVTAEHVAQLVGWASLKQDIAEIKEDISAIKRGLE